MVPETETAPASAWGPRVEADVQEKWKGRKSGVKRRVGDLTPGTANPLLGENY